MKTVKLSYSILNAWATGKFEDAVAMYLGKPIPSTPYMELGKAKHTLWENHTNKTGQIHPELKQAELSVKAIPEQKYRKILPFSDEIQILISGVIDLEYGEVLVDYKCGRTQPSQYVDGWQLDLYKFLRPHATLGKYICYNPYSEEVAVGVKFLSDKNAEHAIENIITYGGELIDYLQSNKLLKDFKEV